jgi:uncharacterized protein (DUF1778 family)
MGSQMGTVLETSITSSPSARRVVRGVGAVVSHAALTRVLVYVQSPYMATSSPRTERIELRAQPARARRIRQAAKLRGQSLSAFMLEAASTQAEEVLASGKATVVRAAFFDELWAALSRRPQASAALAKRSAARRRVTQRG